MRSGNDRSEPPRRALTLGVCLALLLAGGETRAGGGRPAHGTVTREYSRARELFERLWQPGETALSGGDGLGPLFNERSCVGCHHLGGTGGAGDNSRNVTILSAVAGASAARSTRPIFQGELETLHPGFRGRSSIVLHRHSTSAAEEARLDAIRGYGFAQTRDELFSLFQSQRSTPALFGSGRIDSIPDEALLAAEARTFPAFPEIRGRVSRLRDGRLGRFGWKGQTASLADFVLAACAHEVGLEVRGHHQPSLLPAPEFDPSKISLDLSGEDCALMTRFVASLPTPTVRRAHAAGPGLAAFEAIGCATCHAPEMGRVRGLYSDLLLHDLGDRVRDFGGGYGGGTSEAVVDRSASKDAPRPAGEAGPTEWRTPPLWGVADSAPYLHDGRARTLHDAIMMHGGEAEPTRRRYESLSVGYRRELIAFLRSQVAPSQPGPSASRTARTMRGGRE